MSPFPEAQVGRGGGVPDGDATGERVRTGLLRQQRQVDVSAVHRPAASPIDGPQPVTA